MTSPTAPPFHTHTPLPSISPRVFFLIDLSIHPSIPAPIHLSACLSICKSLHPCFCRINRISCRPSVSVSMSMCVCVCAGVCLPACLSVCVCVVRGLYYRFDGIHPVYPMPHTDNGTHSTQHNTTQHNSYGCHDLHAHSKYVTYLPSCLQSFVLVSPSLTSLCLALPALSCLSCLPCPSACVCVCVYVYVHDGRPGPFIQIFAIS